MSEPHCACGFCWLNYSTQAEAEARCPEGYAHEFVEPLIRELEQLREQLYKLKGEVTP